MSGLKTVSDMGFLQSGIIGFAIFAICSVPPLVISGSMFTFLNSVKDTDSDCSSKGMKIKTVKYMSLAILLGILVVALVLGVVPVLSMTGVMSHAGMFHAVPCMAAILLLFLITIFLSATYWNVCNRCKDNHKCNKTLYVASIICLILSLLCIPAVPMVGIPLASSYIGSVACASNPDKCVSLVKMLM